MIYHFNYSKISISWMSVGMTANIRIGVGYQVFGRDS